jgi:hypothetical protein
MTVNERGIINGGGSQTSSSQRWGDYSSMSVDPSSPTTFWYTTEYYATTSSGNWKTRIASFTLDDLFSSYATAFPVKICEGDSSQLDAVAYGGSGTYTYLWSSIPAGFTSTLKNPKVAPTDTTIYVVQVSDGIQSEYDTTQINVIPLPYSFAGNDTLICSTVPVIELHGIASSYRIIGWATSGDGQFSIQDSVITTYSFGPDDYAAGSVDLTLVALPLSPCVGNVYSTKHVTLDPCTGISEASRELDFTIQPNPVSGSATINISGLTNDPATLTLTNLNGYTLFSAEVGGTGKSVTERIDLRNYPIGVYIVKVRTNSIVVSKQLILSK